MQSVFFFFLFQEEVVVEDVEDFEEGVTRDQLFLSFNHCFHMLVTCTYHTHNFIEQVNFIKTLITMDLYDVLID